MYVVASLCVSKLSSSRPVHPKRFVYVLVYVAQEFEKVYQPFHPRSALQRLNFQGRGAARNTALKSETW